MNAPSANASGGSFTQAHFKSVVEGSLQGILIQQDGHIVYANAAMARLFGYDSEQDLIGLDPFLDLILDADLQVFRDRTAAVYRGERVAPHPGWRARHRHGREVWLMSSAHVSEWLGRPAVTSFYFDITERRHAEEAVKESEARYRAALTAGRMGAWETDLLSAVRTWTEEGLALFGLTLADRKGCVSTDPEVDEHIRAMHPSDRHLAVQFRRQSEVSDSFPAEYRIVRPDGSVVWLAGRRQVVSRMSDGRPHRLISIMADVSERKAIERQNLFLAREVQHRSNNLLDVVKAIARQSARSARSSEEFLEAFEARLQSLSAVQDLLTRQRGLGAPLRAVVLANLAAFADADRVDLEGPDIQLTPDAAKSLGMAIHELATNAVKYGALSNPAGRVSVTWTLASGQLVLAWAETGGPAVAPPTRKGFGHAVLEEMIEGALGGDASLSFAASGVRWEARLPQDNMQTADEHPPVRRAGGVP
jgi:PAS domain S-box-containing protein